MKKIFFALSCLIVATSLFAQDEDPVKKGFGAKLRESNFHLGVDLQTKYI